MRWFRKQRVNVRRKGSGYAPTVFYVGFAGENKYLFSVTPVPRLEEECPEDGGIWCGGYAMVTLLNLSQKTYFLPIGGPPLGWEYIAEKYELDDDEAIGFTEIIRRVLGQKVRLSRARPGRREMSPLQLQVIRGGRAHG